ncbi:NYN domain-containing protein [Kribbella catacumbae]|uniref:NYN domain-containing protein n=1 Tax=Kribbella catacumbae TaxID=460086 RepID=UPI000373682F|nr:NYN domain-containing protein [Kribbella catacumbae]
MGTELRASIVIDYQNVHLTGHSLFESTRRLPKHETLVDPLLFASQLLNARNSLQKPGMAHAILRHVLVYRGQPSVEHDPEGYARNQAQKSQWERDRRIRVTLRPLKYDYERDATGRQATDHEGKKIVKGPPREKGVDVLCALATVREANDPATDLVILATSDSDLAPALDEVRTLGTAKIETFCWYDEPARLGFQLHPTDRSRRLWNTRLNELAFRASWDRTKY